MAPKKKYQISNILLELVKRGKESIAKQEKSLQNHRLLSPIIMLYLVKINFKTAKVIRPSVQPLVSVLGILVKLLGLVSKIIRKKRSNNL